MKNIITECRIIHYANFRSNRTPHHLYILLKQGKPGKCFNMKGGHKPKYHLPSPLSYIIISLDYDANIGTKI